MATESPILPGQIVTAGELNNIPSAIDQLSFSSVTNSNAQTVIGTFPSGIPSGDASVNSGYQFNVTFNMDCTGSPTIHYILYVNSIASANIIYDSGTLHSSGTHTFQACAIMTFMICTLAGTGGTFDSFGFGNFNNTSEGDANYSQTRNSLNTTIPNQIILTAQWGTANAANTARTTGGVMRRS